MFTLGVIPARGGSKRIPRKNIRPLAGKPLIAWTIDAANASKLDHVIVSTDDPEIAQVATQYGADVPFLRPPELATDTAKSVDVLEHAARWADEHMGRPDYIVLLQPTSPTRSVGDINWAISTMQLEPTQGYVTLTTEGDPNGLLYVSSWDLLINDHTIWNMFSTLYICLEDVVDIDTEEDWKKAEKLLCK